jgi:hypothetical protein
MGGKFQCRGWGGWFGRAVKDTPAKIDSKLKRGGAMADGREEREEQEKRREQEKRKDQEDRIDRYRPDEWEPERAES